MTRWVLLALAAVAAWWLYTHGTLGPAVVVDGPAEIRPTPAEPGGRLGGGLNPFVADTDHGSAPQRPQVPSGIGR
jgi:hypothetical protein